jgi:hypothetical protein
MRSQRDDLTLAEIECTLDLLDAEISSFRQKIGFDVPSEELEPRIRARRKLASLAARLQTVPA